MKDDVGRRALRDQVVRQVVEQNHRQAKAPVLEGEATDMDHGEEVRGRGLLELVLVDPVEYVRIDQRDFCFEGTPGAVGSTSRENFRILAQTIIDRSPDIFQTPATRTLLGGGGGRPRYFPERGSPQPDHPVGLRAVPA